MTLYCWGSTVNGELGLGGIEEEHVNLTKNSIAFFESFNELCFFLVRQVLTPRQLDWSFAPDVEHVSCGPVHTLFLVDGKVYSSGNNDFGQLGHEQTRKRPRMSTFFCM